MNKTSAVEVNIQAVSPELSSSPQDTPGENITPAAGNVVSQIRLVRRNSAFDNHPSTLILSPFVGPESKSYGGSRSLIGPVHNTPSSIQRPDRRFELLGPFDPKYDARDCRLFDGGSDHVVEEAEPTLLCLILQIGYLLAHRLVL